MPDERVFGPTDPREASGFLPRYSEAVERLVSILARSPGLEPFWNALGREIAQVLPCYRMSVLKATPDESALRLHRVYRDGEPDIMAPPVDIPVLGTAYGRVFLSGIPMIVDVFESRYMEHGFLSKEGLLSGVIVPVTSRSRIVGTLNIGASETNAYGAEALDLAIHFANLVSLAFEHEAQEEQPPPA